MSGLERWTPNPGDLSWLGPAENLDLILQNGGAFLFRKLPWDSSFFGKSMWKLEQFNLGFEHKNSHHGSLNQILKMIGADHCISVVDSNDSLSADDLQEQGWECVESRVQYSLDLAHYQPKSDFEVVEATLEDINPLGDVAAHAVNPWDRFRRDCFFDSDRVEALFKLWVKNSIEKSFADSVVRPSESPYAFLSVKNHLSQGREKISVVQAGLAASSKTGHGIFGKLTESTLSSAKQSGADFYLCATQEENIAIRRSLEKIGMNVCSRQKVFRSPQSQSKPLMR